jgi:uncharacterized protein
MSENSIKSSERHPILIKVRNLDQGDHSIAIEASVESLEYPFFHGTVSIQGTLTKSGDRLHLHANASSEGDFECTRCMEPFARVISAPIDVAFVPPGLVSDPEDPNVHVYDPLTSAYIDITEDIRDALALAIPMKNLCRPHCKGLCPTCGKDLNLGPCGCTQTDELTSPWTALKGIKERLRAEEN